MLGWEETGKRQQIKYDAWEVDLNLLLEVSVMVYLSHLPVLTTSHSCPLCLTSVNDAATQQEPSQKSVTYLGNSSLSPRVTMLKLSRLSSSPISKFAPRGFCKQQYDHPNSLHLRPCLSPDPLLLPGWTLSLVLFASGLCPCYSPCSQTLSFQCMENSYSYNA